MRDLTVVIISDTPFIAPAVIDSLPAELPYFLVGHRNIAFLRRSNRCRQYFENDLSLEERNKADFIQTIERLGSTNANLFLIPVDDSANRIVHSTFDHLRAGFYPIPDSSSFELLNDKWKFHQYCTKLGVPTPNTVYMNDKAQIDFDYLSATVGLPFILKPTNKSNSLGVRIIRSKEQLDEEILSNRKYNFFPLIAQTFIHGVDVDISVLADHGHIEHFAVQIKKEKTLCFVQNDKFVKFTETLVRNLCYTGVIHIDARLDETSKEIFLVEANPRFWGSVGEATLCGLNFVRAGICIYLGCKSPDPTTISGVGAPSVRRVLFEIAMGRKTYQQLPQQQRLRIKRVMRSSIQALVHLPFWS